ncbi:hypothetical protein KUTeg_002880 [Tegillarca granosa]|uniref:Uncharacterized protein n=1 Tax=Tegillarca granosa TaxID=220873 RepID=A0ABQ9FQL2_TEGGR|nr:hypothetical protein KUTeg_002880 [Tegillarca granosa]
MKSSDISIKVEKGNQATICVNQSKNVTELKDVEPQSDETAKFIWYIMKEAGVEMPSFTSIKNIRFGDLAPESLLGQGEGNDGTPCWFIKPSQLLKMAVSHLKTSNDLIRYGRFSSVSVKIREQADGKKWKKRMSSVSAWKCEGEEILFKAINYPT